MRLLIAMMLFFPGCAARSAVMETAAPRMEVASIPDPVRPVQVPPAPPGPPALTIDTAQQIALQYHKIEEKLVGVVSSDNVTPAYIKHVQLADTAARRKLAAIETVNGHPSHESIEEARAAVGHLGDVLAQPPDQADP